MVEVRDPIVLYNKIRFSIDEYLRFEKETKEKHEFFQRDLCYVGCRYQAICLPGLVFRLNRSGPWELEEYKSVADTLTIPTVNISMSLAEMYEGTKL